MGGTLNDGSLVAYLININGKPTIIVQPSHLLVLLWNNGASPPPGDNVAIFGSDENNGVIEFLGNKTERAKVANTNFRAEIAGTKNADVEVLRLKYAVQSAIDWADNKNMVGGPLDILELRKGQTIHWIQQIDGCK